MRMMLKISIPVEAGNNAIKDGSLPSTIQGLIERLKPEASYFFPEDGQRTAGVRDLWDNLAEARRCQHSRMPPIRPQLMRSNALASVCARRKRSAPPNPRRPLRTSGIP